MVSKLKNNNLRKKWMTAGIYNSISHKDFLYNLTKLHPKNKELQKKYKHYNKILSNIIFFAKKHDAIREANSKCTNPKKIWLFINRKLGRNKKLNNINTINCNNQNVTEPDKIAEAY